MLNKNKSKVKKLIKFVPILDQDMIVPFPCSNPGAETIGSNLIREFILPNIDYDREIITTPDGGALALDWLKNQSNKLDNAPIALFIHGYVGNSQADYIKLLLPEVRNQFRVVSLNYRGRGGVNLQSAQMFNLTESNDLKIILDHIKIKFSKSKIFAIAFSLGGSICIQYLARAEEENYVPAIDSLITISSPTSGKIIMDSLASNPINQWLSQYMTTHFIAHVNHNMDMVKQVPVFKKDPSKLNYAMKSKSIKDILERFDVPMFGFKNTEEFFASASVVGKLHCINIPVVMLHAEDDPIAPIDCECFNCLRTN